MIKVKCEIRYKSRDSSATECCVIFEERIQPEQDPSRSPSGTAFKKAKAIKNVFANISDVAFKPKRASEFDFKNWDAMGGVGYMHQRVSEQELAYNEKGDIYIVSLVITLRMI